MRYLTKDDITKDYAGFIATVSKEPVVLMLEGKEACCISASPPPAHNEPNGLLAMLEFAKSQPLNQNLYDVDAFIRKERDAWE